MQEDYWLGKIIGKYRVIKLLNAGGMGVLYQAYHETLSKTVALKMLHSFLSFGEQGEQARQRFYREARMAAQLKHPNIVDVYDIDTTEGIFYIVMEFVLGKSLGQILNEQKQIPLRETLYIGREVVKGLLAAHNQRVIHRDIKPANIMLDHQGKVKITDFGLARPICGDNNVSMAGQMIGTPLYMAPESLSDNDTLDLRTDLYALGISIYEMLTGTPPYTSPNNFAIIQQHLFAPVPSLSEKCEGVPPAVEQMVTRLLAKSPDDRYQSADELLEEITRCLAFLPGEKLRQENLLAASPFLVRALKNTGEIPRNITEYETQIDISSKSGATVPPKRNLGLTPTQENALPGQEKIKVLIVDDSSLMRKAIQRGLEKFAEIEVVGTARHGKEALELIPQLQPDVVTLDVNMPIMDGITTLKNISVQFPCPVVMLSAFTTESARATFECLSLGALDFISKPSQNEGNIDDQLDLLVSKIKASSRIYIKPASCMRIKKSKNILKQTSTRYMVSRANPHNLIVMGAGSDGYGTYLRTIPRLLKSFPCAIIAVQYLEAHIFSAFCDYLNSYSRIVVKPLEHGEIIKKGVCYLINAPGNLLLASSALGTYGKIQPSQAPPSDLIDRLMTFVAKKFGSHSIGVLLTGKEKDGIEGIARIKEVGGITIAQAPNTCLHPENVNQAIENDQIDRIVLEADIPAVLWHLVKNKELGKDKKPSRN